ncbi:3-oxoacyl-[acyl-carrier-protein] reductase FabG [Eumeta japonica]|uniref:3-oxoacyl-[acyl-carrier-protein] reductase FabG n=1 Tax=Eumeta variegata TaxID=151549 RepID=A0A4C1Y755_EUMVA|nr:3-oxoacyl-[acyl-carrier-protein] reductase FabG [Eumeta japonica]
MDFHNKIVIITGASSGIGAATAESFARKSATLVLVGRNEENLKKVAKICQNVRGIQPLVIKADVNADDELKYIVKKTINAFGKIDILINNVGITSAGGIRDGIQSYDKVMSTNVRSIYLLTSLVVPYLITSKGSIVNVSSVLSRKYIREFKWLAYSVSKAALDHFTRCIALELSSDGVRVNSINPGAVKTSFFEASGLSESESEQVYKMCKKRNPLGKIVESEEVSELIVYLTSDSARSITGASFVIDNVILSTAIKVVALSSVIFIQLDYAFLTVRNAISPMMEFHNKVVLITGASSGIGAAAAELFAKQSAKLVLVGRNLENLRRVAEKCESERSIKPLVVQADLNIDSDVEKIIAKTIEQLSAIDVLVNNAGFGVRGSIYDGVEPFDRVMATNVRAVYLLTSLAVPHLVKAKGVIINVSSVAAFKPIKDADYMPYCMSKAALDQFTKCLALEMGPKGVRVNSVNPGGTKTPFAVHAGFSEVEAEQLYKARDNIYPLRKMAESQEVADLILYLASQRARSITGGIYVIDNGETLM